VVRSKSYLEDLIGRPIRGYRAPCFSITDWAIPILQEAGFDYDSSVVPAFAHDRYGRLDGVNVHTPIFTLREGFCEVSLSCLPFGKHGIPWGGGGYFRLVPYNLWCLGVRAILRSGKPYSFYIHPWEIDPGQPVPDGLSASSRFRHRVNLDRCEERFTALVGAFHWKPLCKVVDRWRERTRDMPPRRAKQECSRLGLIAGAALGAAFQVGIDLQTPEGSKHSDCEFIFLDQRQAGGRARA
jgi:polysaccharide deacetylase family protein (PEP-CTERM system associated)